MNPRTLSLPLLALVGCFSFPDSPPPQKAEPGIAPSPSGEPTAKPEPEIVVERPAALDDNRLAVGRERVCLTKGAKAYCLGTNKKGELGDGTEESRGGPIEPGAGSLKDVWYTSATVYGFSCALAAGKAYCWGAHSDSKTPQLRADVKGATWMSGGNDNYCFVHQGGKIRCITSRPADKENAEVKGIDDAAKVYMDLDDGEQGCAVTTDGKVKCWGGDNKHGALGRGFAGPPPSGPTLGEAAEIAELSNVDKVVGYDSTWCALTKEGETWCWGENRFDILGADKKATPEILKPTKMKFPKLKDVSVGSYQVCGLEPNGAVQCFGYGASNLFPKKNARHTAGKLWSGPGASDAESIVTGSFDLMCISYESDKVTCYGDRPELGISEGAPKDYQF